MIYTTPDALTVFVKQAVIANHTTISAVANTLNISSQSLTQMINRGTFKVSSLNEICNALGYDLEINFVEKQKQD